MNRIVTIFTSLVAISFCFSLHAEVIHTIRIESNPNGARVYLLRSSQRMLIGTTPFNYRAEFHSKLSVLRLQVKYPGYRPYRLEISAAKHYVVANLTRQSLVLNPHSQKDPILRDLQRKINPKLTQILSSAQMLKSGWSTESSGEAKLQRFGTRVLLVIPLTVTPSIKSTDTGSTPAAIAKHIWTQAVASIVRPTLRILRRWRRVDGLIIDTHLNMFRHEFHVGQHVQTHVEMRCASRTHLEYIWDELKTVTDPCASLTPTTVSETKLTPSSVSTRSDVNAKYLVFVNEPQKIEFSRIAVLLSNHQIRLWQQGSIPKEVLGR